MKKYLSIFIGLLGITLVIVVHEFGHFSAAQLFNIRTPIFSVGFNPVLLSYNIGGTKFQLGAIPIGGYVSINEHDLAKKSYIKKITIMLAGIIFNILFGLAVLYYLYYKAKRKEELNNLINNTEEYTEESDTKSRSAVADFIIKSTPKEAKMLLSKERDRNFIGPIGIISLIGKSVDLGFDVFIYFLAIISLNIAFFNLLPIPFFDGGQIVQATIEALYGGDLPRNIINLIYAIFLILLIAFSVWISFKDILQINKRK